MTRTTLSIALAVAFAAAFAASASAAPDPLAKYFPQKEAEQRRKLIAPAAEGQLVLRPTFVSCGVCYGSREARDGLSLEWRPRGGEWRVALQPPRFDETGDYRGSLMGLAEDMEYEVRIRVGGETLASDSFRTWSSEVPVARTVMIDPADATFPLRISDKGSADGWIRYTSVPGAVLTNTVPGTAMIDVAGASHVLLEGLTIVGGPVRHAISISNSSAVRISNCDISGWGRVGTVRYDQLGRIYEPGAPTSKNAGINFDGAVYVGRGSSETVVERCWIHDPRGRANSWRYSHPEGPEAVMMARPDHSTVIRWCDFIGSDHHRWNDAVEGDGNFNENGGFNRDADVYGNFMVFCNDDCIELDGGQQNVRCFGNRFEAALCGVSIQGGMATPSYLHHNVFSGMGDEFGEAGQTIKTSSFDLHGTAPWCWIATNLFWGTGTGLALHGSDNTARYNVVGNSFCKRQGVWAIAEGATVVVADNVQDDETSEAELPTTCPWRPVGFLLDRARFSGITVLDDRSCPAQVEFTATSTGDTDVRFAVKKNHGLDWFDVSPAEGTIPAGGKVGFTVAFHPEKMKNRRHWRGAFLVRTPEGLSRPVSLYAERTDWVPPFRCERPGKVAVYADVPEGGIRIAPGDEARTFAFEVPKAGRYYFMVRARGTHGSTYFAGVDGGELSSAILQGNPDYPTWSCAAPGSGLWGGRIGFSDLQSGHHTLTVKARNLAFEIEGAVLTDDPGAFEPR